MGFIMIETIAAVNEITWPGAFTIVGVTIGAAGVLIEFIRS